MLFLASYIQMRSTFFFLLPYNNHHGTRSTSINVPPYRSKHRFTDRKGKVLPMYRHERAHAAAKNSCICTFYSHALVKIFRRDCRGGLHEGRDLLYQYSKKFFKGNLFSGVVALSPGWQRKQRAGLSPVQPRGSQSTQTVKSGRTRAGNA